MPPEHHTSVTSTRRTPLKVAAVVFLLSDEAGYITGQVLGVDGGGSL